MLLLKMTTIKNKFITKYKIEISHNENDVSEKVKNKTYLKNKTKNWLWNYFWTCNFNEKKQ